LFRRDPLHCFFSAAAGHIERNDFRHLINLTSNSENEVQNFHVSEFLQINSGDFRLTSPTTAAQQGGSIVLLSSAAARLGLANHEAIAAAKARIEGLAPLVSSSS